MQKSQKTILLERLTLEIIKLNTLNRRKITSIVITTLEVIKIRPLGAPTVDRTVNIHLNALKTRKGGGVLQRETRKFDC